MGWDTAKGSLASKRFSTADAMGSERSGFAKSCRFADRPASLLRQPVGPERHFVNASNHSVNHFRHQHRGTGVAALCETSLYESHKYHRRSFR